MRNLQGKVEVVSSRPWQSVTLHSFRLVDDATWYRLGRSAPTFREGDVIAFTERNTNVDPDSVELVEGTTAPEPKTEAVKPMAAPAAPNVVGDRIRYQAARSDATKIVVAALHTDALPWAANVAKSKKLDLLTGYVEQITKTLLEQEDENGRTETK